ncbi:hypothetical protein [Bacillus sp. 123MFChir2]|uniref:hypothetical protein n=1 Tax=Bacillus sp. 123MFChir2 TaxID=1169144 RepID=UPI00036F7480|nr:hypothetical protein [Bacillus sp. 123MFChir2]
MEQIFGEFQNREIGKVKISALQREVREFSKEKGFEDATIEERTIVTIDLYNFN